MLKTCWGLLVIRKSRESKVWRLLCLGERLCCGNGVQVLVSLSEGNYAVKCGEDRLLLLQFLVATRHVRILMAELNPGNSEVYNAASESALLHAADYYHVWYII